MIGIVFVILIGCFAHFLYDWTGNNQIVGFLVPINESVWEHIKLLFFPMLLYTLTAGLKCNKTYPCFTVSLCFGNIIGTLLIPILFYAYTSLIGKNFLVVDIGVFVLCTLIAFLIALKYTKSSKLKPFSALIYSLIIILVQCFILFTSLPPNSTLFVDPTAFYKDCYVEPHLKI